MHADEDFNWKGEKNEEVVFNKMKAWSALLKVKKKKNGYFGKEDFSDKSAN